MINLGFFPPEGCNVMFSLVKWISLNLNKYLTFHVMVGTVLLFGFHKIDDKIFVFLM